jgi:hypothetical protein
MIKSISENKTPSIMELEKSFLKLPQVECKITHGFSKGVYRRKRFAKANTLIIGKRHRHKTTSVLLKGILSIYLDGGGVEHKEAPCTWETDPGAKRMTYSQTDTVLMTLHPTNETDLKKIEEEVIIPEEEYLQLTEGK